MISVYLPMENKNLFKDDKVINQIKLINFKKKYHYIKNKLKIYKDKFNFHIYKLKDFNKLSKNQFLLFKLSIINDINL